MAESESNFKVTLELIRDETGVEVPLPSERGLEALTKWHVEQVTNFQKNVDYHTAQLEGRHPDTLDETDRKLFREAREGLERARWLQAEHDRKVEIIAEMRKRARVQTYPFEMPSFFEVEEAESDANTTDEKTGAVSTDKKAIRSRLMRRMFGADAEKRFGPLVYPELFARVYHLVQPTDALINFLLLR